MEVNQYWMHFGLKGAILLPRIKIQGSIMIVTTSFGDKNIAMVERLCEDALQCIALPAKTQE
jgi:hypothetical protein